MFRRGSCIDILEVGFQLAFLRELGACGTVGCWLRVWLKHKEVIGQLWVCEPRAVGTRVIQDSQVSIPNRPDVPRREGSEVALA